MSEDSPLADLSEQLQAVSDGDAASRIESEEGFEDLDLEAVGDIPDDPGFPAEDAERGPVAPRGETWERYDDALSEITAVLEEYGVTDPAGREFDDAVLRLAVRNPEAIARLIVEARQRAGSG